MQFGVFLVLRDGLDTSYARSFLASTNARFYKELDREIYLLSFVETPRKFIIAELSIRKLGSSSVLIIRIKSTWFLLLALMKIRAYGSKALQ